MKPKTFVPVFLLILAISAGVVLFGTGATPLPVDTSIVVEGETSPENQSEPTLSSEQESPSSTTSFRPEDVAAAEFEVEKSQTSTEEISFEELDRITNENDEIDSVVKLRNEIVVVTYVEEGNGQNIFHAYVVNLANRDTVFDFSYSEWNRGTKGNEKRVSVEVMCVDLYKSKALIQETDKVHDNVVWKIVGTHEEEYSFESKPSVIIKDFACNL